MTGSTAHDRLRNVASRFAIGITLRTIRLHIPPGMMSYRHAFHAGNFADVVKHVVLTSLLAYQTRKDAGLCYVDTHAGAGCYPLHSGYALKTGESRLGIGRLRDADDAPEAVRRYLDVVRRYNQGGEITVYPGSPAIAASLLRPQDRLMLCELHGSDYDLLQELFRNDHRVHCFREDGYRFSTGLLPPRERRGLVFMDPSYELRDEYDTAATAIGKLWRRFSTGVFALWYPILDERRTALLRRHVTALGISDVLHLVLRVADQRSNPGMYGCGVIVINPPWTLRREMDSALPWLASRLAAGDGAAGLVEQWVDE